MWFQLLWPWSGPPWYERVENLDAYLGAYWCPLHLSAAELAELLAGDDPPGEGYLAKARRLTAARRQAQESISQEYGPAPMIISAGVVAAPALCRMRPPRPAPMTAVRLTASAPEDPVATAAGSGGTILLLASRT
jgi:hypothetical protein